MHDTAYECTHACLISVLSCLENNSSCCEQEDRCCNETGISGRRSDRSGSIAAFSGNVFSGNFGFNGNREVDFGRNEDCVRTLVSHVDTVADHTELCEVVCVVVTNNGNRGKVCLVQDMNLGIHTFVGTSCEVAVAEDCNAEAFRNGSLSNNAGAGGGLPSSVLFYL